MSALEGTNVEHVKNLIVSHLPNGSMYFPNDTFTDRSQRFYASEAIREQLFLHYEQEIPYSCEVYVI